MPVAAQKLPTPSRPAGRSPVRPGRAGVGFAVALAGRKADAMENRRPACAAAVLLALFGALLLAIGGPLPAASGTEPRTGDPAEAAAGWLARQLVEGERFEVVFDGVTYPAQGLTADAVLAFGAADVSQQFAERATAWLAREDVLVNYLGYEFGSSFAGSHAKLALVAMAQDADPRSFGEIDLIGALQDLQAPSGRLSDTPTDFSNAIGQSLGVIALVRAGEDASAAAAFLAGSQCPDGGFAFEFGSSPCASEPDATGFAVQALLAAGGAGKYGTVGLDDIASRALDYLESVQRDGGGFGGIGPTLPTNANSTAVAAQALRAGGRDDAADAAVGYLLSLQVGCAGPAGQRGAVTYDGNGFTADTAVRSTAQAVPALAGVALIDVDNAGDAAAAPVLACTEPTSSPTSSPTGSPTSSPTTAPTTSSTNPAPQPGTTPKLPATGAPVGPSLWTGALLILAGALLMMLAVRRRTEVARAGAAEEPRR